jgi:hypothetical protein
MLSWNKFVESKMKDLEDKEEKLGKDLDGDNEEGESKEHKKKVFGKIFGKEKVAPDEKEQEEDDEEEE